MRLRRLILPLIMISALPACSGGPKPADTLESLRQGLAAASYVEFSADIRADYADRVFDFGVSYAGGLTAGTLEITSPAEIAGVKVRTGGGAATLSYDGVEVYTGEILPEGLSPVDAVPAALSALTEGLVTETVAESFNGQDCVSALYRVGDRVDMRCWLSVDEGLPLRCEFSLDGRTVVTIDFKDMKLE